MLALYSGLLFYLSHKPSVPHPPVAFPSRDKALHLVAYLVWGGLFASALWKSWPGLGRLPLCGITLLAGTLYGISDELHQSFIPERSADVWDLAADALGALLGGALVALCRHGAPESGPSTSGPPDGS
jgi:VanZ family protein